MDGIFTMIVCIGVVGLFILKYREAFSKLTKIQKVGVLVSYILTISCAGICIYYGSSILTNQIQNKLFILIIDIAVVVCILAIAVITLNRVLQKITKGIFPNIT